MALATLIAVTLACIGWSLWIRRVTWSCRWEVAATLNIALQGAAVLLMSPLASATLGQWLHSITGLWNLEDYIAHDCYIVAASAVVYNALGRLQDDHALQASFKQYVERPATLCIPLMLATYSLGNGSKMYASDFFDVPTDFWLNTYWLVLCGTLIYLLGYGARALLVLRQDPRSRGIANVYLTASACGAVACLVRIGTAYIPGLQEVEGGNLVWLFACACGAVFALASAHSWRVKTKWFIPADH
ncbi:hypothetical protein [Mycolicibacterium thermoresistibile]|jgi:hypothetical protein|uniref:GP55 protein n=1 Tax=Mycolicibacterium thermoresistibile TaxID=1797 RepID=A0A124E912_MYCTH|nr:hypothetical protein [Mycolicibacterium thermoresistibile]MCV7188507.1 hypothetical protein [Mycolicibacterium thermoresistibile]GAT17406.1 GP55 protein [Mycolicibacterium thermoresistibile]SNW18162.1 GP55 protein [Mycolicibacterium thermoresistibile]